MSFIEELLIEAEIMEEEQTEAYHDFLLIQIRTLQEQIANNFLQSEKEINIIKDWALKKNAVLQERVNWLEKRLQAFIIERGAKTIDLANGTLKFHKKPDKVEITDLDLFLKNARPEMITVVPEQFKPDLNKIKAYLKSHLNPPPGVTVTEGKEEFTYKLKGKEEADGAQEIRYSA